MARIVISENVSLDGVVQDPTGEEGFAGPTCTTFDGRALAVVRPTDEGKIIVTVSADDCEPQRATVDATA